MSTKVHAPVRAVLHDGVLRLLDPLDLPEGAQVRLWVQCASLDEEERPLGLELAYPTRLVPAERLDKLTGVLAVGGDALADSEALYDPDWN